jgi:hypothetical protein
MGQSHKISKKIFENECKPFVIAPTPVTLPPTGSNLVIVPLWVQNRLKFWLMFD